MTSFIHRPSVVASIETLEPRIAPASLINLRHVNYTDVDGDTVSVIVSKGSLAGHLTFDTAFDSTGRQQLQKIDLTGAQFSHASLIVKVTQMVGGDGLANIGVIDATGVDLGVVTIPGDVGQIIAGDANAHNGSVAAVTVGSLGKLGLTTGAPNLLSAFYGSVGALRVHGDVNDARVTIDGDAFGNLGLLGISGSLIGGTDTHSGAIAVSGKIGPVSIGVDVIGHADKSGQITSTGSLGNVFIGRDLIGGDGTLSGLIRSGGRMGFVHIGGKVQGGNGATDSGAIIATGQLTGAYVKGSVTGGAAVNSGEIRSGEGMGPITILGDLAGGSSDSAGQVKCGSGVLKSVFIGGSVKGGLGGDSGEVVAFGVMGPVTIMHDIVSDVRMTTAGSFDSGEVEAVGDAASKLVSVTVHGSLLGGNIISTGHIGAVNVYGSVVGGMADRSGFIGAQADFNQVLSTTIGSVVIRQDLIGGSGSEAGSVAAIGLGKVVIVGSLKSGAGAQSGSVRAAHTVGVVAVRGDVVGTAAHPVVISAGGVPLSSGATDVVIGAVTLNKTATYLNILGGYGLDGTAASGHAQIGTVTVGGLLSGSNIVAGATAGTGGFFGTSTDAAIPSSTALISRIARVTLTGGVAATADATDSYGIVAQYIAAVKVGAQALVLTAGAHNDKLVAAGAGDLFVNEVAHA